MFLGPLQGSPLPFPAGVTQEQRVETLEDMWIQEKGETEALGVKGGAGDRDRDGVGGRSKGRRERDP